jgi:site-specific DNA recombinase
LSSSDRKISAILKAVEDGLYNPSMKQRLTALEAEKTEPELQLAKVPAATPIVPHPNRPPSTGARSSG